MTRAMKTIRNLAVTAAVLAAYAWLSGGFLTPVGCVMTSMEQLGFTPCEILREDTVGAERLYVLRSAGGQYAVHSARRGLLFWHAGGGETHMDLEQRRADGAPGVDAWGVRETYSYALFVRDDDTVDTAAWTDSDGQIYRACDWTRNCTLVLAPGQVTWRVLNLYRDGACVFEEAL